MSGPELRPECAVGMHDRCAGTQVFKVARYRVPVVTFRCDCRCHGKRRPDRARQG